MFVTVIKHNHRIRDNKIINTDENAFAFETSTNHGECGSGMP
jgi:hypothetical protein